VPPTTVVGGLRPKAILRACYTGMFVQAMLVNLTPLLFVTLAGQFGLSFEQVGRLVLVNFASQMLTDLVSTAIVDRVSAKALAVVANVFAVIGLWIFALAPFRMADPYLGLMLGTVVFSIGSGLLEVIISPIVERTPGERKAAMMQMLHAFYPIGKVIVTVTTALLFFTLGTERWPWMMLGWSIVPALNAFAFAAIRLPPMFEVGRRTRVRDLLRTRATWLAGRLWFGFRGSEAGLVPLMRRGAIASAGAALLIAFAGSVWLSLAAVAVAGLATSLLWPGVVSLASARFPLAGASLFALLAAAGHTGAGFMPWMVGIAADQVRTAPAWLAGDLTPEQIGLRVGVSLAAVPAIAMLGVLAAWTHEGRRNR